MKYKLTIIIEGDESLKKDLEEGHVQNALKTDIFEFEEVLEFSYEEIKE